jgi:arginase
VNSERLAVIGVPTSAGAFAPGQEQAPATLREAGLIERLTAAGLEVRDDGDRELWRWRPDRTDPRAQHVALVVAIVADTARRVGEAARSGELTLVLGGDCTVGIGTVAGHAANGGRIGLVYFDAHADLNVPEAVPPGALDWMGMAHMLAEGGARRELVEVGPRAPLLDSEQVVLLGWDPGPATPHERAAIERLGLAIVPAAEVSADPPAAANRALGLLGEDIDTLIVHFDVDVVDFADTPLSENPGRNEGISYAAAAAALRPLLGSPLLAGLTVTELNPDHIEQGSGSVQRLVADLADGLAATSG